MKPIYELMSEEKLKQLFIFYTTSPNVREYPIYFDHKVADNYSSFPLIYTYGIIPNNHNKNIIHTCKKNRIPIKKHFSEFERIPLLKNCNLDKEYNYILLDKKNKKVAYLMNNYKNEKTTETLCSIFTT